MIIENGTKEVEAWLRLTDADEKFIQRLALKDGVSFNKEVNAILRDKLDTLKNWYENDLWLDVFKEYEEE